MVIILSRIKNSIFKNRPNYWLLLDNVVINFLMGKSGLISEGSYFTLAQKKAGKNESKTFN